MTPDPAALNTAIREARHLLFAFDGPIRRTVKGSDKGSTADSATPTAPHIHETFEACRESGRSVVVIGPKSKIDVPTT